MSPDRTSLVISEIAIGLMPDVLIERAALLYARGFPDQADAIIEQFVLDHMAQIESVSQKVGVSFRAPDQTPQRLDK